MISDGGLAADHVCCAGCGCAAMDGAAPTAGSGTTVSDYTGILAYTDDANYRWNVGTPLGTPVVVTYSILDAADLPDTSGESYSAHAFNPTQATNFRAVIDAYEATAGVVFVEVDSGDEAMFEVYRVSGTGTGGFATYAYSSEGYANTGGSVTVDNGGATFAPGTYPYLTMLHELGHAMGLQHPFSGPNVLDSSLDNHAQTVMSYSSPGYVPDELGPLDVQALQHIYGAALDTSDWSVGYDSTSATVTISSGQGADTYVLPATATEARGRGGSDAIEGRQGDDVIYGDNGNDTLVGGQGNDSLRGGFGRDDLDGGWGDDNLRGGGGDDVLRGGRGADRLAGDGEADTIYGGDWTDTLYGNSGDDELHGEGGNDRILGGRGGDTVHGGDFYDTIYGQAGDDSLMGNAHGDLLNGGSGNDTLRGGSGWDDLYGSDGADRLYGGDDNDRLYGGNDADALYGEAGNDTIVGHAGDDFVFGGDGNDRLLGGGGRDTFVHTSGSDRIIDFQDNLDVIRLSRADLGLSNATVEDVLDAATYYSNAVELNINGGADDLLVFGINGSITREQIEDQIVLF